MPIHNRELLEYQPDLLKGNLQIIACAGSGKTKTTSQVSMEHQSEILFYKTEDGKTSIQVRLKEDTVWLTQEQLAELFQRERTVITKHINSVFREGELAEESNVQKLHIPNSDKPVKLNSRADSSKPLMGMVNFKGNYITTQDVRIAKNYLTEKELNQLTLIVSLYLDFAELQASNERAMSMTEWISKLDQFLTLSEKEILLHPGKVSAEDAARKAAAEFEIYRAERIKNHISDFDKAVKELGKEKQKGEINHGKEKRVSH